MVKLFCMLNSVHSSPLLVLLGQTKGLYNPDLLIVCDLPFEIHPRIILCPVSTDHFTFFSSQFLIASIGKNGL